MAIPGNDPRLAVERYPAPAAAHDDMLLVDPVTKPWDGDVVVIWPHKGSPRIKRQFLRFDGGDIEPTATGNCEPLSPPARASRTPRRRLAARNHLVNKSD